MAAKIDIVSGYFMLKNEPSGILKLTGLGPCPKSNIFIAY